jgi:hypothetical protein
MGRRKLTASQSQGPYNILAALGYNIVKGSFERNRTYTEAALFRIPGSKKLLHKRLNKNICNLCNGENVETCQISLYMDLKYMKVISE